MIFTATNFTLLQWLFEEVGSKQQQEAAVSWSLYATNRNKRIILTNN
jgi:hypothetical protein